MLEVKVVEWNAQYSALGREVRLKDIDGADYEALVADELLGVCDGDVDLALSVFNHKDNQGGWMVGDVPAALERRRARNSQ